MLVWNIVLRHQNLQWCYLCSWIRWLCCLTKIFLPSFFK